MANMVPELAGLQASKEIVMGKKRVSSHGILASVSDHRIGCDPVDRDEQWGAIYAILKANIGEWPAFNWFSHVRFLSVHGDSIRLEHWCAFAAQEALNRHGAELCAAAGVKQALIRFSGGTIPHGCMERKADGYAVYLSRTERTAHDRK